MPWQPGVDASLGSRSRPCGAACPIVDRNSGQDDCRSPQRCLNGAQDIRRIGELARGLLGIDAPSVQGDFEHAPGGGDQLERPDFGLETQQLRRQTDGVGFVVSGRAIFDDDLGFHERAGQYRAKSMASRYGDADPAVPKQHLGLVSVTWIAANQVLVYTPRSRSHPGLYHRSIETGLQPGLFFSAANARCPTSNRGGLSWMNRTGQQSVHGLRCSWQIRMHRRTEAPSRHSRAGTPAPAPGRASRRMTQGLCLRAAVVYTERRQ